MYVLVSYRAAALKYTFTYGKLPNARNVTALSFRSRAGSDIHKRAVGTVVVRRFTPATVVQTVGPPGIVHAVYLVGDVEGTKGVELNGIEKNGVRRVPGRLLGPGMTNN